jgi:hypothetical protein
MSDSTVLFQKQGLRSVMELAVAQAVADARECPEPVALAGTPEELAQRIAAKHQIGIPALDRATAEKKYREIVIRGRPDIDRYRSGPTSIPGTEFSMHVPFTGDEQAFFFIPSRAEVPAPHADIQPGVLIVRVEKPTSSLNPEEIQRDLHDQLERIERHLNWLREDVKEHDERLRRAVLSQIVDRRKRLSEAATVAQRLGFKRA